MKTKILYFITVLITGTTLLLSCSKDNGETFNPNFSIAAKATIGEIALSKVSYIDNGENSGIATAWESGDVLNTFETENDSLKICNFTTTGTGTTADFTSKKVIIPSSKTRWKALYGAAATVSSDSIICGYDNQNGTLTNLKNYDYMIAEDTGTSPTFNFDTGTHLSSFIRLKLPEGIKTIEFNASGSWTIRSTKNTAPIPTTNKVSTVKLENLSNSGTIAYIAVPAIDFSTIGIIITIFNNDKSQSQGTVLCQNSSTNSGCITTLDMSGMTLMDRPTKYMNLYEYGKWAPFNVGAKANPTNKQEALGYYYGWGEIEPSYTKGSTSELNYSWTTYMCKHQYCGKEKFDPIQAWNKNNNNSNTKIDIAGSRFDVARVKWGKGWKMPNFNDIEALMNGIKFEANEDYGSTEVDCIYLIGDGIFILPTSGYYNGTASLENNCGYYWSSTIEKGTAYRAWDLEFAIWNYTIGMYTFDRCFGKQIRAIAE